MMMVKDVLIYTAIALTAFLGMQLFKGVLTDVPAECREDQFCGGFMQPIPPHDATAIFPNDPHFGER
jgi:hypothetical protein